MPLCPSAANERTAIIKLAYGCEIAVQQLAKLVTNEDPARAIALRLVLAEMNYIHSLAINPTHITDPQIGCNPLTRQAAGQRNAYRLPLELF